MIRPLQRLCPGQSHVHVAVLGGRYFEIDGIPDQLKTRWSGRSLEVTEPLVETPLRARSNRLPTVCAALTVPLASISHLR